MHLSSLCRRMFKLKGNKKFRTRTKKSLEFFVFRDSYVLCIYVMNILCTFHTYPYLAMVKGYPTFPNVPWPEPRDQMNK